ncbi:hypothetical protein [Janthinobacterium sp. MDT1-19]|uniref:hypothetical protein n=1 Tax=Janthinobacterium sp. MDT1-19 TaxID=1259339 RepID=UPI003F299C3D
MAMIVEIETQALRLLRQVALETRVLGIVGKQHGRVGHRVETDHLCLAGDQRFGIGGQRVASRVLRLQADGRGMNGKTGSSRPIRVSRRGVLNTARRIK